MGGPGGRVLAFESLPSVLSPPLGTELSVKTGIDHPNSFQEEESFKNYLR